MSEWSNLKKKDVRQPSIFDQAERQANEGMELSYRNAPTEWKKAASKCLMDLCKAKDEFTTDEFWETLAETGIHTGEPRALGAIIKGAARAGVISKTGNYALSTRRHKAPIPIWRSNIYTK